MPTVDQLLARPMPMATVDRLLAHERQPGAPVSAPASARSGPGNLGLLATLGRTLNGLPYRAPLPSPRPKPAPPTAQPAPSGSDPQQATAHANMLRVFPRLKQLVGGELTRQETILVNQVGWLIGREATDEEIEAIAQYLAAEFERGIAGQDLLPRPDDAAG
jgi:hypothetical protein